MPSLDPVVTGEPMCRCGRSSAVPHCPSCGSRQGYAIKTTARRQLGDGTFAEFVVRRCRRCTLYYDDWQWRYDCHAPELISERRNKIMQQAKVVEETVQQLRPNERSALERLKAGQASKTERLDALRALFKKPAPLKYKAPKLSGDDVADIWDETKEEDHNES